MVASTVAEIENLMPWLAECKKEGKEVNVSGVPSTNPPTQTHLFLSNAHHTIILPCLTLTNRSSTASQSPNPPSRAWEPSLAS